MSCLKPVALSPSPSGQKINSKVALLTFTYLLVVLTRVTKPHLQHLMTVLCLMNLKKKRNSLVKFLNKDLLWQFSDFWFVKKKPWIAPSLWFQKLEIGGQSLVLIFTLGQTGGIMGMTLVEPCHKNNSNWHGKVLSHQHTIGWLDNLLFLISLNFRSSQWLGSGEKTSTRTIQVKCAITSSPVDKTAQRK